MLFGRWGVCLDIERLMMQGVIRVGDKTSYGGVVLSGASSLTFMGKSVASLGDKVSCPKHGNTNIIEGDNNARCNGKPIALHGHRCACGCTLITSLPNAGKK